MKKDSLCFIDDEFANVWGAVGLSLNGVLTENAIRYFIKEYPLNDSCLQDLVISSLDNNNISVSAFSDPNFFIDDETVYPNYIVYDWDYSISGFSTEEFLQTICKTKFCYIFIFTGCDKIPEIEQLIKTRLIEYENRISIYEKEEKSIQEIINKIKETQDNSFSFKFGTRLRDCSWKGLDTILIELAKYNGDVVSDSLKNYQDLVEFIGEKYKSVLNDNRLEIKNTDTVITPCTSDNSNDVSPDISPLEKLWEYRLYSKSLSNTVQKGDILKKEDEYWFIITPNCELQRFWNKTYGVINYFKLYELDENKEILKEILNKKSIQSRKGITSFTNSVCSSESAPYCIPFINNKCFLLFPKEICSQKIEKPSDLPDTTTLTLDMINNTQRIATINNPFLSEIIEQCLSKLKGYGVTDYDSILSTCLMEKVKKVFD